MDRILANDRREFKRTQAAAAEAGPSGVVGMCMTEGCKVVQVGAFEPPRYDSVIRVAREWHSTREPTTLELMGVWGRGLLEDRLRDPLRAAVKGAAITPPISPTCCFVVAESMNEYGASVAVVGPPVE